MAEVDEPTPMVSNPEPPQQEEEKPQPPQQDEVVNENGKEEAAENRDGSKENKSPKDKEESGGKDKREKDREKERASRRHGRKNSRSRSGSNSPKRRDRDRDRRKDKEKEKDRHDRNSKRRSRSKSRSRSRSRRRRSRSNSRGKHRHASKSPSPRRREKKTQRNWDLAPPGLQATNPGPVAPPPPMAMPAAPIVAPPAIPNIPPGLGIPPGLFDQLGISGILNPAALAALPLAGATAAAGGNQIINGMLVTPQLLRQARRLYVGNVPVTATEQDMSNLFNSHMLATGKCTPDNLPIMSVQLNPGKGFAFLECRTPEDANSILQFDGIPYGVNCLKVRRPKDFKPIPGVTLDPLTQPPAIPGVISTTVPDSEFKIYLGGLPQHLSEMQVRELVSSFGDLKAFNLVKEAGSALSKGYCFFEFVDHENTEKACQGLNNFELAGKKLICQRASTNPRMGGVPASSLAAMLGLGMVPSMGMPGMPPGFGVPGMPSMFPGSAMPAVPDIPNSPPAPQPTRILKLSNMITAEELKNDEEYDDIVTDVREECSKFGHVVSLQIPRPVVKPDGSLEVGPGVAGVFVEFSDTAGSERAHDALKGRQFASRVVMCSYFPEADYAMKNLF